MGRRYAAYDPELDRKVAIKLLRPGYFSDAQGARARLLREAQALARLAHPNVVAVHDVGTHEDQVWLAMEYIEGQTLGRWRSSRPRAWREVLAVVCGAGRGLAAAHAAGLVHRDIKPENIMVGADGRPRLMDLGLARPSASVAEERARDLASAAAGALDELQTRSSSPPMSTRLTVVGAVVGTPAYMPPSSFGVRRSTRAPISSACA